MKSIRVLTATALLTAGVLGLAGCGRVADRVGGGSETSTGSLASDEFTALSTEAQALQAIGFSSAELAAATDQASGDGASDGTRSSAPAQPPAEGKPGAGADAGKEDGKRPLGQYRRLRFAFGKRTLHGEAVVQTEAGVKTVAVQRGTVTEINDSTVTVRSTDGVTWTWTFGDPIRVLQSRGTVAPSAIEPGMTIGVAGAKQGETRVARLIVVPRR